MTFLPRFEVRTLDMAGLQRAALELQALVLRDYQPDIVLGIRSGGYVVAQMMVKESALTLLPITCRRPSTEKKQKSSAIKKLLLRLPRWMNDRLRILEHIVLTQLRPAKRSIFVPDASELAAISTYLAAQSGMVRILIVDDAVDSGNTLAAVHDAVRVIAPASAIIKTAVLTVTTTSPLIQPDFTLYRYVLCRFPWSLDFKQ